MAEYCLDCFNRNNNENEVEEEVKFTDIEEACRGCN